MTEDLYDVLIEFEFLDFKIYAINPQSIIEVFYLALGEKIGLLGSLSSGTIKPKITELRG